MLAPMAPPRKVLYLERDIQARQEKLRAQWRARKSRERKRKRDLIVDQAKLEEKLCVDGARLEPHIDKGAPGACWMWRGGYVATLSGPRPIVRAGQYGRVYADVAVWLWYFNRRELPRGARLKRSCDNRRCVAPHHGIPTNQVVERARARKGGLCGSIQQGQEGPEGGRRAG